VETGNVRFPNGKVVPPIGQGSWHLGQGRRPADVEAAAMRTGIDLGLTLIDTAEMYGEGRSERHVGHAIAGRREEVFLVSKVLPSNATRHGIPKACDASLTRLGVDRLDLYLLHWPDGRTDLAEVVDAFEALRGAGKIRAWGVSNFDVDDMEALFALPDGRNCATNQVLYNLGSRGIEFALLPWCAARGVPVMAYTPLGGSRLLRDATLARIAAQHGCPVSAVALAWAARSGGVIAIPEAGNPAHVAENARALTLELTADDLLSIDAAFPPPHRKAPLDII
jgi:diketogulonate reductase-like aldo/keto reductase